MKTLDRRSLMMATGGVLAACSKSSNAQVTSKSNVETNTSPVNDVGVAVNMDNALHIPLPKLEFAFRVSVEIGKPTELGIEQGQRKRMIPITGGTFKGPKISGIVLPGGEDWQSVRPDGTADILALYSLKADDGTIIRVRNPGYRHAPREVLNRLANGDKVSPSEYYFRTSPQLSVSEKSPHAWLGKTVFTCTAARFTDDVVLDYYAVI